VLSVRVHVARSSAQRQLRARAVTISLGSKNCAAHSRVTCSKPCSAAAAASRMPRQLPGQRQAAAIQVIADAMPSPLTRHDVAQHEAASGSKDPVKLG